MSTSITLNAFLMSTGHHEASWRLPGADPTVTRDARYFQELARTAERGRLDSVFFADSPSIMTDVARRPAEALEPAILLAAMAVATEHIGLVATASTTYEEPYNLARTFASLDALSGGRAGWNVVTSADLRAGANFGWEEPPSHDQRYARATEFLETVLGLWDTWQDDAVVADRERGIWADPDRIQPLGHVGEHFSVAGPLNVGRSAQGRPVIVQAGSSGPGIALAAAYAEAVFTAQPTLEEGRAFYRKLKDATAAAGRDPEHLRILPGLVPVLGGTEAEARELERRLDELVVLDHPLRQLAARRRHPGRGARPRRAAPGRHPAGRRAAGQQGALRAHRGDGASRPAHGPGAAAAAGERPGHRAFVGTPEQVADTIEESGRRRVPQTAST